MSLERIVKDLNIPERCQECPGLKPQLVKLAFTHRISDNALLVATSPHQELLDKMPEEFLSLASQMAGAELDPNSEADRQKALAIVASEQYSNSALLVSQAEDRIKATLQKCKGEGPIKMRGPVPDSSLKFVIELCRADIDTAPYDHTHVAPVSIRKENPYN